LGIAIWQVVGARRAAESAEKAASAARRASDETRSAIHGVLTVSDLQRVIGYVQQIKIFHRDRKWETSLNLYQVLRSSLVDIRARLPDSASRHRLTLQDAIAEVTLIEDEVEAALEDSVDPVDRQQFNSTLNEIQAKLEEIVSSAQIREAR
jgi:hypothetical protein